MKTVAAAAFAAFAVMGAALPASAATTTTSLGVLVDGDAPIIGTGKASTGSFTDTYNFTLSGSDSFSVQPSVVVSVVVKPVRGQPTPPATASITDFTLSLFQGSTLIDSDSNPLALKGAMLSLSDDNLLAGTPYSLVVSGTVNSVSGQTVSYGGSMPVTGISAVPLPTSVALFGTAIMGLGVAGAMRRKGAARANA